MAWDVPGYEVAALLGAGASGEVWLARELDTGDPVALKRLRSTHPSDLAGLARMHREAVVLGAIEHPHLLRLRQVLTVEGEIVLVLEHAAGGSLAALLDARGAMAPGEVVTMATPLAGALAAVHEHSVVHGDLSPGNVLFTADGRPLLADLGMARLAGEPAGEVFVTPGFDDPALTAGAMPTEASDVYALASVCVAALSGHPVPPAPALRFTAADLGADGRPLGPEPLLTLLNAALAEDPAQRPTAQDFAVRLYDACPAQPVRLPAPAPTDDLGIGILAARAAVPAVTAAPVRSASAPRRGRKHAALSDAPRAPAAWRRLPLRQLAVGAAALLLLLAAVSVGRGWARWGEPEVTTLAPVGAAPADRTAGPPPAGERAPTTAPPARVDWVGVLTTLDAARAAAFATGSRPALDRVYERRSPAGARDAASLRQLVEAGLRARPRLPVDSLRVVGAASSERVVLEVRDRLAPYEVINRVGRIVAQRPGRGPQTWRVSLVRSSEGWRIWDVQRA